MTPNIDAEGRRSKGGSVSKKPRSLAEQIGHRCVHFTGMQHDTCKAGVAYTTVTIKGKGFQGIPCFREGEDRPCDKRRFPSAEEVAAQVTEHEARWERLKLATAAASEDAKKQGFQKGNGGVGVVKCPVCGTGELHYSVSGYNGHMWGKCRTKECVSWMQ